MVDGESGGSNCDEVNQEENEENEVDGMKKGADFTDKAGPKIACFRAQNVH